MDHMTRFARFLLLIIFLGVGLPGCNDYSLRNSPVASPSRGDIDDMPLGEFRDCSEVLGDNYWYKDHEFGVVIVYGGCLVTSYAAYLIIEHEFWDMDKRSLTIEYETPNGDTVTAEAWEYTLEFWYNPADIEVQVIPHMNDTILGIHEFQINCMDDDQRECDVEYTGQVDVQDFN